MSEELSLKDKCKGAQKEFDYFLDENKPVLLHIDGKNFSKTVKNKFNRPFDDNFINIMNETAKFLCENIQGAKIAYIHSDEISILLCKKDNNSNIFFNGRLCKIISIASSLATSKFNQLIFNLKGNANDIYQFDCKAWNVDDIDNALKWFLYRNIDCMRNSKNQTASTYLGHKALMNKTSDEQIDIIKNEIGVDWNSFSDGKKYGRIIVKEEVDFTNKNGHFLRNKFTIKDCKDLTDINNREEFKNLINI